MTGKHLSDEPGSFRRDLPIMIAGILVVGAIVFGGIWLITSILDGGTTDPTTPVAGEDPDDQTDTTSTTLSTTTTTVGETTTTVAATTTTEAPPTTLRAPADIDVIVLNSTTLGGAAGRLSSTLADAGYSMLEPDDFAEALDQSRVWYVEGYGAEALELAAFIPDAVIERIPELDIDADIVVVIGATYEE